MLLLSVAAVVIVFAGNVDVHAVKLSVYYESLCPDSINFIKYQMYPTWLLLTADNLDVDMVPYGKATQQFNTTWSFECQHGPNECLGNKVQACALDYLTDNTKQVQFVSCVMSTRYPPRAGSQCAAVIGIDYNQIQDCADGPEGDEMLAAMGNRTHEFRPEITFVPTIAINDVYSQEDQDDGMSNLLSVICRHIEGIKPVACNF